MKKFILFFLCFWPVLATAQNAPIPTQEEISKDKNYLALKAELAPFDAKFEKLMAEFKKTTPAQQNDEQFMANFRERYAKLLDEHNQVISAFILKHSDSYVSLMALAQLAESGMEIKATERLYKNLSAELKKTELGNELGLQIASGVQTAIGSEAPDFTQNDPSGKPVSLSDFRGKYVLIDFWASWCGPCRNENPTVVRAYNQFKSKNFEILGVSLDNPNAKKAWTDAIKSDKLTWAQVSDLRGWKNKAAILYGVKSIPQNFLLDPNGIIIGKNLRGEALIQKLNEVLK
ncbi:MAG: TlpA family protein disulfide reductase [Candidatus Symbiothrix sp.]|jgi:peroxiredoxin|nr:TlpA family protein disulfide reductase [Candidatus Symbiothrix sp.]